MKSRALVPWLGLLAGLVSCRALTEPGLAPRPAPGSVRIEGRVFLPDGSPATGGDLVLDNRIYEPDRDDWVQARIALDAEGRFDTLVGLGEFTDVIFEPTGEGGPPPYRFLGVRTAQMPWVLRHPMREVALELDLPDSLRLGLRDGDLHLRTRRPRPADRNPFHENYALPIDSTATVRGWLLPGGHELELNLRHRDGSELEFEFADSVDAVAQGIPSLRPWLRGQHVELVLPEGIPGTPDFEFYTAWDIFGETTDGRVRSWTVFPAGQRRVWAITPLQIQVADVSSAGAVLMTRPSIETSAGPVGPIYVADHWLELVRPPGLSEEYRYVVVDGGTRRSPAIGLHDGRALFLVNRGTYYIEVRDADHRRVAARVYESTDSRTLTLDF